MAATWPVTLFLGRYVRLLRQPLALLEGQVVTLFGVSLYVKLVQMCDTNEYAGAWIGHGRFLTNCLDYVLFCGQEISFFAALLIAIVIWRRCDPAMSAASRCVAWTLGLVVLPILSGIEVLGLAHFAFFLTPLGPEEMRQIAWTRHIVSASRVLDAPEVALGLGLVLAGYYLIPCGLWLPRPHHWPRGARAVLAVLVGAGVLATSAPKPQLADALLAPHPLLWMLLGTRVQPAWADAASRTTADSHAGRLRFTPTERPVNVLIFVLESTRAQSLAVYNGAAPAGHELLPLADEMVVFERVYAPVPTSAHAIFSILYGVYPYLGPFWSTTGKSVVADSMAQYFSRAGYATQFLITSDLSFDDIRSFAAPGFDRVLDTNDWPGQEAFAALPWGRDDRLLIDEVKRFLTSRDGRPFFVFAMTSNPHHPYALDHLRDATGISSSEAPQAAYERLVDYDLHLLVELYDWMKHAGVAERTLLVVLGDHGEAFGEHAGNYGHGAFIYEENVHIPCFILHPRRFGLPRRVAQLGSEVDLRATILDILGRRDAEAGDGMSLLREDPERLIANFAENGVSRFGLRDTRFTYIYTPHVGMEQVFDRRDDPMETQDLVSHEPSRATRYRARLQQWEAQHQLTLAKVLR